MNDINQNIIDILVQTANEMVPEGVRLVYFGRDTESGNARIVRYDGHSDVGMVAVGTPREMWQFLRGFVQASALAVAAGR